MKGFEWMERTACRPPRWLSTVRFRSGATTKVPARHASRAARFSFNLRSNGGTLAALHIVVLLAIAPTLAHAQGSTSESPRTAARRTATSSENQPTFAVGDVHTDASRVYIHVLKTGLGHEHAVEGRLTKGTLHLGREQQAGQLVFDMKGFQADTDTARRYIGLEGKTDESTRAAVDKNMLGSSVLDVQRYPTAVFDVESAKQLRASNDSSGPVYQLKGQFTLHGVKRPLAFQAVAEAKNGWTRLRGNFVIKQTEFGMTPFTKAFGAVGVADPLTIYGDVWIAGQLNSSTR